MRKLLLALLLLMPAVAQAHPCQLTRVAVGPPKILVCADPTATTLIVPKDFDAASNKIETYGPGGAGDAANAANLAPGGGGGAYSAQNNVALIAGSTVAIGLAGDAWLCSGLANCSAITGGGVVVGAKGGAAGVSDPVTGGTAGLGGVSASGVGATKYPGGNGTAGVSGTRSGAGGGSAGPSGAGANAVGATGGSADFGSIGGGIGGDPPGAGRTESLYAPGFGPGSGAGAHLSAAGGGMAGGKMGGGGSGSRQYGVAGGLGGTGAIVLTYTPTYSLPPEPPGAWTTFEAAKLCVAGQPGSLDGSHVATVIRPEDPPTLPILITSITVLNQADPTGMYVPNGTMGPWGYTAMGNWGWSVDPGLKYTNEANYPANQVCPSNDPNCFDHLFNLTNFELRPGYPFAKRADFPSPVPFTGGDGIIVDLACSSGNSPANIMTQTVWTITWIPAP